MTVSGSQGRLQSKCSVWSECRFPASIGPRGLSREVKMGNSAGSGMPGTICFQLQVIQRPTKRTESNHLVLIGQIFIDHMLCIKDCSRHRGYIAKKLLCSQEGYVSVGETDNKQSAGKRSGEAGRRGAFLHERPQEGEI